MGTNRNVLVLQHHLEDIAKLLDKRLDLSCEIYQHLPSYGKREESTYLPLPLRLRLQQRLLNQLLQILLMRLDELVQVALLLRDELFELRPLTSDDFEVAVVLDLADEKDHLGEGNAGLVQVEGDGCARGCEYEQGC
jgi:hypothetical protein